MPALLESVKKIQRNFHFMAQNSKLLKIFHIKIDEKKTPSQNNIYCMLVTFDLCVNSFKKRL